MAQSDRERVGLRNLVQTCIFFGHLPLIQGETTREYDSFAVRAPSSSIATHKFIANGLDVRDRISAITSLMASGGKLCAPNDPSPPRLVTPAVNL